MKSVQPIMEEVRRLAEERRRLPETVSSGDPARFDASDLRRPMRTAETQPFRWLVSMLDRFRRRALQAILIQQSEFNRRLSLDVDLLSGRLETEAEERLGLEQRLDRIRLEIEQLRTELRELRIETLRTVRSRNAHELAAPDGGAQGEPDLAAPPEANRGFYEDPVYFRLESRMRGDEDTVRERQRVYVEHFRGGADADDAGVLDLGCGRGEFLELLREAGVRARGVDLSPDNVARCREKNVHAVQGDALAYLSAQPAESLAGIFACHFIEHLAPDYLLALARACFEKLRPDGRLVVETLNPDSLAAMTIFYADPSHVRPIPPATGRLLLESSGFQRVQISYLSPCPDDTLLPIGADGSRLAEQMNQGFTRLNRFLFAPREYALVATR